MKNNHLDVFFASFLFFLILISATCNSIFAESIINSAHKMEIDPEIMKADNGELTNRTLPIFLKKAYEQGAIVKEASDFPNPTLCRRVRNFEKRSTNLKIIFN